MTRNVSILAAAATVAFLAFGVGEASAMNLGGRGGQPGGPSGPSGPTESHSNSVKIYLPNGCDDRADLTELSGGAPRDYLRRCGPQDGGL